MAVSLWIRERLERHDTSMHDARPDGKPDETEMTKGLSRGTEKKNTEGEVEADEHLLVAGVVRLPAPPCWPNEHQGAECHADASEREK